MTKCYKERAFNLLPEPKPRPHQRTDYLSRPSKGLVATAVYGQTRPLNLQTVFSRLVLIYMYIPIPKRVFLMPVTWKCFTMPKRVVSSIENYNKVMVKEEEHYIIEQNGTTYIIINPQCSMKYVIEYFPELDKETELQVIFTNDAFAYAFQTVSECNKCVLVVDKEYVQTYSSLVQIYFPRWFDLEIVLFPLQKKKNSFFKRLLSLANN